MRNSLAKRLTYSIMAVVLVMMAVITGFVYVSVRDFMRKEAQQRYTGILQKTYEGYRRRLSDVYVAARNNVHDIERDIDNPDMMYDHMMRIVSMNPGVSSGTMLFDPDYYTVNGQYFVPMVRRDSLKRPFIAPFDSTYAYSRAKWYQQCMASDSGQWIGTYYDRNHAVLGGRRSMLTTYATPIHDHQGKPVALLCLQLSVEALRDDFMEDMNEVNEKFEKGQRHQSYCFVIDRQGIYIMHPDESIALNASVTDWVKETPDSLDDRVVASMMNGESGEVMMDVNGVPSWVYYRTIKFVNWTLAIVVPEEVIFHNGRMLNTIILLTMLFGLVVIYFICRHMIKKITNPVTAQQAAIDRELKIAQGIQMAMLPQTLNTQHAAPNSPIDLYASLTPARDVGGDLYDYFLRADRLFFCIGDVTGKGVPAALLMAVMRAMFRSEARRADRAAEIVETMNRNLSEETSSGYFVTMFVGILDLQTGHLDYCNAGHEAPIIAGQPLAVKPNLPIGALTDWVYEGQQAQLKSGDTLFLYTDGLSEAQNSEGQQLGRTHVLQLAGEHVADTAQQLVQLMEAEVHRHAAGAEQSDDITLLAIRWQGSRVVMKASIDDIARLEPFIAHAAQRAGIADKEAKRLRLAVEEAVANVINYSQATAITLQAEEDDTHLVITIDDDGQPFDPIAESPTDLSIPADQRPPGGLGIMLLHEMTDGLAYQRIDGHNILKIIKLKN